MALLILRYHIRLPTNLQCPFNLPNPQIISFDFFMILALLELPVISGFIAGVVNPFHTMAYQLH